MVEVAALAPEGGHDIYLSRLFDAGRDTVWAALTDASALELWWAPDGCTIKTREADIRVGGIWAYRLDTPNGKSFENRHKYEELTRPERIVYWQGEQREDDNAATSTLLLDERGVATLLTLRVEFSSHAWREKLIPMGALRYPAQSLEHLSDYLARARTAA
ncbi:MAG: SRPBCC domain-containing protein [Hyphomicrobiaceae bacterium]|nr:SRPBCC domain-containing protein [Hyphomicrobiaceae bacterium]